MERHLEYQWDPAWLNEEEEVVGDANLEGLSIKVFESFIWNPGTSKLITRPIKGQTMKCSLGKVKILLMVHYSGRPERTKRSG